MIRLLLLMISLILVACITDKKSLDPNLRAKPKYKVSVKYDDHVLKPAGEWLGGTEENSKYYTAAAEEIFTPVYGVDISPVTKRTVTKSKQVVYPHFGYKVVGDLKKEHYLSLIRKIKNQNFDRSSYKPPVIIADSNFLEKGAIVKKPNGDVCATYEFKLLNWYKKN